MKNDLLIIQSEYVVMRDGIRLAVTTWLPENAEKFIAKCPAVIITTRYWRARAFQKDGPQLQGSYPFARYLSQNNYILVIADARGSGASFGSREAEISSAEVEDIGELIAWVSRQSWSDGRVATTGTSYTANTALYSLVCAPAALEACVCRAPDFDVYRHLLAPGGIVNHWFIKVWGESTAAMDSNDISLLFSGGYWPSPEDGIENLLGVRPVDTDSNRYQAEDSMLAAALRNHRSNFNLSGSEESLNFVDSRPFGTYRNLFDPSYKRKIESRNTPIIIRCGWHDAGTQLGALSMFTSFNCSIRVILGPWSHGGEFRVDPFEVSSDKNPEEISEKQLYCMTIDSLNSVIRAKSNDSRPLNTAYRKEEFSCVDYYTLGENRWKSTAQWPLPQTKIQRLYLAADHKLDRQRPVSERGCDRYRVDQTASTGLDNRWHAQTAIKPILFFDRREEDKKLLVYDTPPLDSDIEITGHPVVYLYVRSTATDGQFFVYLETIDLDGRISLITEGQLRGIHHKISTDSPPYNMFGPYHSLKQKDAQPLIPGKLTEISFDLFPISVLLKKGQRIRLAIAGADRDTFAPIADCESPELTIERNYSYGSCLDLPII